MSGRINLDNMSEDFKSYIQGLDSQLEHKGNNEYTNLNNELSVINLKNIIINDTHKIVQGMCITNNMYCNKRRY